MHFHIVKMYKDKELKMSIIFLSMSITKMYTVRINLQVLRYD
jgi:hypothetical protein